MARQLQALREKLEGGATRGGWKVGLNVPAVQEHLGIDRPVVGHLTSATRIQPGADVAIGGYTRAGVEPEIAALIGAGSTVEALAAAIEIVDIDLPFDDVEPIVAANVFHRGWVTGPELPADEIDLEQLRVSVIRANAVDHEVHAADEVQVAEAMGDLATVLAGVAARAEAAGESLRAGDVVICGSLTPIVWAEPGDEVEVRFDGPLGSLRLSFS